MTFFRLGHRKGRVGILARSALAWAAPARTAAAASFAQGSQLNWLPARVVSASFYLGESVDMSAQAVALLPAAAYWGDAGEMQATGSVVP